MCVRVYDRPAKAVATLRISFVMCIVCFAFRLLEFSSCNFFSVYLYAICLESYFSDVSSIYSDIKVLLAKHIELSKYSNNCWEIQEVRF